MPDANIVEQIMGFESQRIGGMLHAPEIVMNGSTDARGLRCLCGERFDCDERHAPTNQPFPRLWVGWQAFLKHIQEEVNERVRELYYDSRSNT